MEESPSPQAEAPTSDETPARSGATDEGATDPAASPKPDEARGKVTPGHRELVRRARLTAECAKLILDPPIPWQEGTAALSALRLYRDAIGWLLAAMSGEPEGRDLAEAWGQADTEILVTAAGSPAALETLRRLIVDFDLRVAAEKPADALNGEARRVAAFVDALLEDAERPYIARAGKILRRRLFRAFVALAAFVILSWGAYSVHLAMLGRNVLAGKPWHASSHYPGLNAAARMCDGQPTDIFFHTGEDDSPWVEFDLRKPTEIFRVEIENRGEGWVERAVPLVVEIKKEDGYWLEVARQEEVFRAVTLTFTPVTTTAVRLRVLKKTWFHLHQVVVR